MAAKTLQLRIPNNIFFLAQSFKSLKTTTRCIKALKVFTKKLVSHESSSNRQSCHHSSIKYCILNMLLKQRYSFCSKALNQVRICVSFGRKIIMGYLGNMVGSPQQSIVNFLGPVLPRRAENPSNGILEVPVTNYKKNDTLNYYIHFSKRHSMSRN